MERRFASGSAFLNGPHVNLKKAWRATTRQRRTGLQSALAFHNLEFEGVHHRGIDDARNIARLLPFIDEEKVRAGVGALQ